MKTCLRFLAQALMLWLLAATPEPVHAGGDLAADLEDILAGSTLPSLAWAVVSEGEIVETGVLGAPPDAAYRAGSLSKTVTTLLILSLVEEGRLSLDTPVAEVLPEIGLRNRWEETRPLRLVHLLEQTSGLAGSSYADHADAADDIAPLEAVSRRRLATRWPPGMFFSYANINHTLAAAMAERVTGVSFDMLMRQRVLEPLGLGGATFDMGDPRAAKLLESVDETGRAESPWRLDIRPSGGLIVGIGDLARLTQVLATDGASAGWLSPQAFARMRAPETSLVAGAGYRFVYGAGSFPFVAAGEVFHGHWGRIDGFQTTLGVRPGHRDGFALIANGADRVAFNAARERLAAHVSEGRTVAPPPAEGVVRPEYQGWWMPFTDDQPQRAWLMALAGLTRAEEGEGGLTLATPFMPGAAQTLIPAGEGRFRPPGFPIATHVFAEDASGTVWLFGDQQLSFRRLPGWLGAGIVVAVPVVAFSLVIAVAGGLWRAPRAGRSALSAAWFLLGLAGGMILALLALQVVWGMLAPLSELQRLARPSFRSLTLAALSLLWPFAAAGGVWFVWRGRGKIGRGMAVVLGIVCLSLAASGVVLAWAGWMPFLTWSI